MSLFELGLGFLAGLTTATIYCARSQGKQVSTAPASASSSTATTATAAAPKRDANNDDDGDDDDDDDFGDNNGNLTDNPRAGIASLLPRGYKMVLVVNNGLGMGKGKIGCAKRR